MNSSGPIHRSERGVAARTMKEPNTMKRTPRKLFGFAASLALLGAAGCGGDSTTGAAAGTGDAGLATGGSIVFTASGEVLALGGYDFPFTEVGFVDGWEVKF